MTNSSDSHLQTIQIVKMLFMYNLLVWQTLPGHQLPVFTTLPASPSLFMFCILRAYAKSRVKM